MSGFSRHSKFASYRAIDREIAITLSASVVILANNKARNLEHMFSPVPERVDEVVRVGVGSTDGTVAVVPHLTSAVDIVHQQPKFILREHSTSRTAKRPAGRGASAAELAEVQDPSTFTLPVPLDALWPTTGAIILKGALSISTMATR